MINDRLFLDIHAIQILPPSNVNRDDTGSPKTANFGGVTRARVSSQAWKREIRKYFCENGQNFKLGVRTKKIVDTIVDVVMNLGCSDTRDMAKNKTIGVLENSGYKLTDGELDALYFFSDKQIHKLAELTQDEKYTKKYTKSSEKNKIKKELTKLLKPDDVEIDIALFGRMLAGNPELNEDASSQVAHAISTHAVQTEYDYFTASDDLADAGSTGAAMIQTNEFNSSTLYRYANVALHEFYHQLKDDKEMTAKAIKLYVEAFAKSMPTGKSNSYANQTFPQALLVMLRNDRPISFVGAYEDPVKAKNGYTEESVKRLFAEEKKAEKFVHAPLASFCLLTDDSWYLVTEPNDFAGNKEENIDELLNDLSQQIISLL